VPDDGRPITPSDVKVAQSKFRDLAVQVAAFFHNRLTPDTSRTMVASASDGAASTRYAVVASLGDRSVKQVDGSLRRNVSLTSEPDPSLQTPRPFAPARVAPLETETEFDPPHLITQTKLVERTSRFAPTPSKADRGKLDALVVAAATMPLPELVAGPKPAIRPQKALADAALAEGGNSAIRSAARVASLNLAAAPSDMSPDILGNGWARAPEFDEDHPDELAYRPFPLAPLLSDTPFSRDQPLAEMRHPDVAAILEVLDDVGGIVPMKFRPGRQLAEVMWSEQFQGKAVHAEALIEIEQSHLPRGIADRAVQTSAR
jgi:hypothetical protein